MEQEVDDYEETPHSQATTNEEDGTEEGDCEQETSRYDDV
jgi:hypothetical protein